MTPPQSEPAPLQLGRYRVVRRIGEGGMGRVYEVEDLELGRRCALKVLQPELHANAEAVERFLREAAWAAGLDHPNVVRVFDRGRLDDGAPYYTMELLQGHDLSELLARRRRLPWSRARHIAVQLCRVLERAHERGIIHRDLKPENCYLVELGGDPDFLKLLDFGIARQEKGQDARLTTTGFVLGTALYMSPQQARGEKADHRADVYAVGVLLYEMLAGHNPFDGENALQVLSAIQIGPVPPLTDYGVAPEVAALVARAMHRDIDARFPSATALRCALEALEIGDAAASPTIGATKPYPVSPAAAPVLHATRLASDPADVLEADGEPTPESVPTSLAKTLYSVPLPEAPPQRRPGALVALAVAIVALAAVVALALAQREEASPPDDPPAIAAAAGRPGVEASPPGTPVQRVSDASTTTPDTEGADVSAAAGASDTGDTGDTGDTSDDEDSEASSGGADDPEAGPGPKQRRPLSQAKAKAWARRQESKPPAACADLSRGYGTSFRFAVVAKAGKASLKRMDGGNTGARCASQLVADFERWAAR
ncbi:MAG: serine/threonine protein kinase, partial [Myxococcales bacterium]|nr:serine/threonine protein kinase [Myxococcales bacterium]